MRMAQDWQADVVVAGGGMAGIAAAVAAARSGADTILIERAGWLGGIGVSGATGLHTFYNLFAAEPGAPRRKLVGGIAQEVVDLVTSMGGGVGHVEMERGGDFVSMLTPVEPETFKAAAARLCREAAVRLLLHTTLLDAEAAAGHVERVRVWSKAGIGTVRGRAFVDCTGDGDLCAAAGADCVEFKAGDPGAYAVGFTFRLCNVDLESLRDQADREGILHQLAHAVKPFTRRPSPVRFGIDMRSLREAGHPEAPHYFLSSSLRPRELTYCNCINYGELDPLDPECLTDAEVALRGCMLEVADFFRSYFEGCRDSYPAGAAPAVGPRRARAVRCDYELTQQDVTDAARFDDEVGLYGWIDNWQFNVKDAGHYGFPYRALCPRGLDNALAAGRMLTVDLVAHNSTRNTVPALVCGQAAGTAAAMAAAGDRSAREVDVGALRDALGAAGVLLEAQQV
jgi:hypothetical protein